MLPFAGFLLTFAALAWLVASDVFDDPADPLDELAIDPVAPPPAPGPAPLGTPGEGAGGFDAGRLG